MYQEEVDSDLEAQLYSQIYHGSDNQLSASTCLESIPRPDSDSVSSACDAQSMGVSLRPDSSSASAVDTLFEVSDGTTSAGGARNLGVSTNKPKPPVIDVLTASCSDSDDDDVISVSSTSSSAVDSGVGSEEGPSTSASVQLINADHRKRRFEHLLYNTSKCQDQRQEGRIPVSGQPRAFDLTKMSIEEVFGTMSDCDWNLSDADRFGSYFNGSHRLNFRASFDRECHTCRRLGHTARQCTVRRKCYLCGVDDHHPRKCVFRACSLCFKFGHLAGECRVTRREMWSSRCKNCRVFGHFEEDCPDFWRQYHDVTERQPSHPVPVVTGAALHTDISCYVCGHFHHGTECPIVHGVDSRILPFNTHVRRYDNSIFPDPKPKKKGKKHRAIDRVDEPSEKRRKVRRKNKSNEGPTLLASECEEQQTGSSDGNLDTIDEETRSRDISTQGVVKRKGRKDKKLERALDCWFDKFEKDRGKSALEPGLVRGRKKSRKERRDQRKQEKVRSRISNNGWIENGSLKVNGDDVTFSLGNEPVGILPEKRRKKKRKGEKLSNLSLERENLDESTFLSATVEKMRPETVRSPSPEVIFVRTSTAVPKKATLVRDGYSWDKSEDVVVSAWE